MKIIYYHVLYVIALIQQSQGERLEKKTIENRLLARICLECSENQFITNDVCQDCHYSCRKCSNSGRGDCTQCFPNTFRSLSNNQCLCQSTYFDQENELYCQKCRQPCFECRGNAFNDCLSCQNNLILNQNECICNQFPFINYYNITCEQCYFSCAVCIGPDVDDCISCQASSMRILDNHKCNCMDGYFETASVMNCIQCHLSCKTCDGPSENNCLTCYDDHSTGSSCTCLTGYYPEIAGSINVCKQCHHSCLLCDGPYIYNCQSCPVNRVQDINTNICYCSDGYFQDANGNCVLCDSGCETCTYQSTFCLSCDSTKTLDSSGHCVSCTNPNCLTCDQTTQQCLSCIIGKYGQQCNYDCDTNCLACNILSGTTCTSCKITFHLNVNICSCPSGQVEINSQCQSASCPTNCAVCSGSTCSQCNDGLYGSNCNLVCDPICKRCYSGGCSLCRDNGYVNNNTCVCNFGYYMDSSNNCVKCNYTCNQCTNGMSCTDCGFQRRVMDGSDQCVCQSGYYEFGIQMCQNTLPDCGMWCGNCQVSAPTYTCYACALTSTNRIDDLPNSCPCATGYFDNGTMICAACDYKCLTCISLAACTQCQINRDGSNNCVCNAGYAEVSQVCTSTSTTIVLVDYNTQTQIIYLSTDCNLQNYSVRVNCQCQDGYYLNLINQKCLPCNLVCRTCTHTSKNCLLCSNYALDPPNCDCAPGYTLIDSKCKSCDFPCTFCHNQSCQSCSAPFILQTDSTCLCTSGYYNDINQQQCYQCQDQCSECQFYSDYCMKCKFNRILPYKCICPDFTFDVGISMPCSNCDKQCLSCQLTSNNCTFCNSNRSFPPTCPCMDGYYENEDEHCQKCNYKCLTCITSQENCLQCSSNRIGIGEFCICMEGYFENDLNNCLQCNPICMSCVGQNENNCLSCDETKYFHLEGSNCVCNKGYYYANNYSCSLCTLDIVECQSTYCGNGIKQGTEQCDDFNNINRDGCSSICKIENGFQCSLIPNVNLNESITFSKCSQCQDINCKSCNSEQCFTCQSGYFLTPASQCHQCNFHCRECKGRSQSDCITCTQVDDGLPEKCAYCEEYPGLYTQQQKCVAKCGDGILKLKEECDDGNILNHDGCSSTCLIEKGFQCASQNGITSQCQSSDLPVASITFDSWNNLYQANRIGKITFSKPMRIDIEVANILWLQSLDGIHSSGYEMNQTYIKYDNSSYSEILITISLFATSTNLIYVIDFSKYLIYAFDGSLLQTTHLLLQLGDYFQVNTFALSAAAASRKFGLIMLIILGGIAFLGLLLQSLEFYWNLLDLLQMIAYLTYINVQFPYMHNEFITLFDFAKFDFLTTLIPIQIINLGENNEMHSYPLLIEKDVQENIIYNLGSIAIIYLTPILFFIITKMLIFIINYEFINNVFTINPQSILGKCNIKLNFLQALYFTSRICQDYVKSFCYKIILRVYLSSLYDLNFAIFASLYCCISNQSPTLNDKIQYIVALLLIFIQIGILFLLAKSLTAQSYSINSISYQQQYGSLYEGIVIHNLYNREVSYLQPLKKMIFMAALLLFYDNPLNQIGILINIQMISTLISITLKPSHNLLEAIKTFTNEAGLLLSLFFILFYYVQQNLRYVSQDVVEIVSYFHVGVYSVMMAVQVIVDCYQQFKVLLDKYPKLKQFFKCDQQGKPLESRNYYLNQQFIIITPPICRPIRV